MSAWYEKVLDTGYVPDAVIRVAIRKLLADRLLSCDKGSHEENLEAKINFVKSLKEMPIAIHTNQANTQHYEVPTRFYELTLGPRLKYSCALYPPGVTNLEDAELAMFNSYCEKAQIKDGMSILDLGCGWGSLSLYLAERFPKSKVTGLSNSATQKTHIMDQASKRGLKNIDVVTADINAAELKHKFDRIISIEMFEHMKNYQKLLAKVSSWMKEDAYLFIHIFTHKHFAYHFEQDDGWMSTHFFTGGTMPSDDLLLHFQDNVSLVDHWFLNGNHYAKTCEAWLQNTDNVRKEVLSLMGQTYGEENAVMWLTRWRVFYMSCAELFAYNGGNQWGVSHYLFKRK